MAPPFTDQGEAAVCARVALALLKLHRKNGIYRDLNSQVLIGVAVSHLEGLYLPTVRLALLSLSVWTQQKKQSAAWLAGVLMRDMYGFSIRRCYYADYKANRRTRPPC